MSPPEDLSVSTTDRSQRDSHISILEAKSENLSQRSAQGARVASSFMRNTYKLPVEINANILNEAIGSSLHDYFITERYMYSGTKSELEQDKWTQNSLFIFSSVSYSFREIIRRTVKSAFNIDMSDTRWHKKLEQLLYDIRVRGQCLGYVSEYEEDYYTEPGEFNKDDCIYARAYYNYYNVKKLCWLLKNPPYYLQDHEKEGLRDNFNFLAPETLLQCQKIYPREICVGIHDLLLEETALVDIVAIWEKLCNALEVSLRLLEDTERLHEEAHETRDERDQADELQTVHSHVRETHNVVNFVVTTVFDYDLEAKRLLSPRMRCTALEITNIDGMMSIFAECHLIGPEAKDVAEGLVKLWKELIDEYDPIDD